MVFAAVYILLWLQIFYISSSKIRNLEIPVWKAANMILNVKKGIVFNATILFIDFN